jgi:hypothetical protein
MQFVYYTIAALLLYVLSDQILIKIETWRGDRLKHRSLVYFVIILVLSVSTFKVIEIFMSQ